MIVIFYNECKLCDHNINVSKLQSYPVLGEVNTYYFHLDLEFDDLDDYENCIDDLQEVTDMIEIIGLYCRDEIKVSETDLKERLYV